MSWRNRIVEQHNVPTSEIAAHDLNWRAHPQVQEAALSGVLAEVGLVQSVVRNLRRVESGWPVGSTPTLVDGHLRLKLAVDAGVETLPVVDVDLSPDEERLILASFDPISAMAQTNAELLAKVVDGLEARQAGLEELLARQRELVAKVLDPDTAGPGVDDGLIKRTFTFCLDADKAAEIDAAFTIARGEAPRGATDDDLFHAIVTR